LCRWSGHHPTSLDQSYYAGVYSQHNHCTSCWRFSTLDLRRKDPWYKLLDRFDICKMDSCKKM
jgi:hypothetical protein